MFDHLSEMRLITRASGLREHNGVRAPFLIRVSEDPSGEWFANLTVVGDLWKSYTCRILLSTDLYPSPEAALGHLNQATQFLKEGLNMTKKYWVLYTVLGKERHAGPYTTPEEVAQHRDDIAGFEGVTNVSIVEQLPSKDRSRIDRLLEDDLISEES